MKQKEKTTSRVLTKRHFLSNIKMNVRLLFVCLFALLPSMLLFATLINRFSTAEENRKFQTEQTITAVAEQYVDTSVENIVSIAKTIYTNSVLYNFLNTNYASTAAYYDAFYVLQNSNSLIISDNSNIQSFTVYTDNKTILNGGNIGSLSNVKDQPWYLDFERLNKNMILYCDTETGTLSLIRKLDYYTVETGDCIMKIDFNGTPLQSYFENLSFDGDIYVMSDGILLYSNISNLQNADVKIDSSYSCFTKNYYTVEIEYYARANQETIPGLLRKNLPFSVPFLLVYFAAIFLTYLLMHNVSVRVNRLSKCYTSYGDFTNLNNVQAGKDEIGQLYNSCIDLSYQLDRMLHEGTALTEKLDSCKQDNDTLLMQALHQDALLSYYNGYRSGSPLPLPDPQMPVPLSEELQRLRDCMQFRQVAAGGSFSFRMETEDPGQTTILPLSLVMVADDMINLAQEEARTISLHVSVFFNDKNCIITIRNSESEAAASRLLKFRAIFESERETESWSFTPKHKYNPYLRLKKFYQNQLECSIDTDPALCLTFVLTPPAPEPPPKKA